MLKRKIKAVDNGVRVNTMHKKTKFLSKFAMCSVLLVSLPVIAQAEGYSYDSVGRLTRVTYDDNSSITYAYDNAGNILKQTIAFDDADQDGIADTIDNCVEMSNPAQRDTDGDGFGNFCDADLDNNMKVDFGDLAIMRRVFFTSDPDADLNGDASVSFGDLAIMKRGFFQSPGPSGLVP